MKMNCVFGLIASVGATYMSSSQRLRGFNKNDAQVAYYGALTIDEAAQFEHLDATSISEFLDSSDRKSTR